MTLQEHNMELDFPNLWVGDSACRKLWRARHCRFLLEGGYHFPLHAQCPSPREHTDKSGTGYIALRRMTRTFSQTPPINPDFIQPVFTVPWIHHDDSYPRDSLFSYPRMLCFGLLLALIFLSKSSSDIPSSRKSLHPLPTNPGHSPMVALTHYILGDCSFVCLARGL